MSAASATGVGPTSVAPSAARRRGGPLLRYIARRLAYAVLVVVAAYAITFALLWWLPSDPVRIMLGGQGDAGTVDPQVVADLTAKYGFDQPPPIQFLTMLGNALQGDLGVSIDDGRPVAERIAQVLPHTLQLGVVSLVLGFGLGIGIGLLANLPRSRWLRGLLFSLPPLVGSLPSFLIGLLLIQVFAYGLSALPAVGNDGIDHLILPAIALAVPTSAGIAQVTARALDESVKAAYSDYLRAKGISRRRIILRHSLRNAIIPATTLIGLSVGSILAGAVVTETVFTRQGFGRLMQEAVTQQDIPVVQGIVLLCALLYAVVNLLTDLVYPLIDPRVTLR